MNILTRFLSSTSNILLLGHPMRTALGFVVGLATKVTLKILSIALSNPDLAIPSVAEWEFGVLGIALLHIPTIKYYLLKKGGVLSEDEEKVLSTIRDLKISDFDKQTYYFKLIEKFIDRIELKRKTQEELEESFQVRLRR